ncbi:nucleotide disphospho-sugar-binding domain-containing protein [Streptomyces sp. NBC_00568]|uniref:glycosyltransferase n=1 Tax=Streptomyces sp. NBC_00568 TaxID=2975779 RepID=UPI002B1E617B|nr:nucleotide disphospho-sugar-binding domain-containing protein [Streptomyces sp. NBC_00568]
MNPSAQTDTLSVDERSVRVTGFVPMRQLLQGIDVVVSSGGAGTVLAALGSALPMVLLPMGLDKPLNAERAAALGTAALVDSPEQVGDGVAKVLRNASFTTAAADAARQITTMNPADQVLSQLLELMP